MIPSSPQRDFITISHQLQSTGGQLQAELGEGERSRGMRVLDVDLAVRLAGIVGTTEPHSEAVSLYVILLALPGLLCRTNPLI